MDWGTQLWDRYDDVTDHTLKGIEFVERYAQFMKDRVSLEQEYASKLKKLTEKYQPKKKEEDEYRAFSSTKAFLQVLQELQGKANQHDRVAEEFQSQILSNLVNLTKDLKDKRKVCIKEGQNRANDLRQSSEHMEKSKRQYEKAFRDSEKALDAYNRAEADINLSRAEVEKAKSNLHSKNRTSEQCKSDYAAQLQNYNQAQRNHYTTLMPNVFQQLQQSDRHRIEQMQRFILEAATVETSVMPITNNCFEAMKTAAQAITFDQDAQTVTDRYRSGFPIPEDVDFEDLSNPGASTPDLSSNGPPTRTPKSVKTGTIGKTKGRGLKGFFSKQAHQDRDDEEDFRNLAPAQRVKKLQQKLDALQRDISKETQEREGILKMKDVYEQNPNMGDPSTLEPRLLENDAKLAQLRAEYQKYERYLQDAMNSHTPRSSRRNNGGDNVSRSASDISGSLPGTPHMQHDARTSSEDGSTDYGSAPGSSRNSYNPQQAAAASGETHDSFDESYADTENLPALGKCKALYPFPSTTEGSISMEEDEEFIVTEKDQGDGWTRVRKDGGVEGYVPTTYIQILQWYEAV